MLAFTEASAFAVNLFISRTRTRQTKPMDIRKAETKDLDRIIELGAMLQEDSRVFEPKLVFDMGSSHNHYRHEIDNHNAQIIVAVVDNYIVGYQYSYVRIADYLVSQEKECIFEALYVMPRFRHQGIGGQLINEAKKWAITKMKVKRIIAHIYNGNKNSESLHLKDGFHAYNTEYLYEVNSNQ